MTQFTATEARALVELVRSAIEFSYLAACDGLSIGDLSPEEFLLDYSCVTDEQDWPFLGDIVSATISAALAENERLRGALKEISCPHVTDKPLWWQAAARAALAGETDQ